MPEKKHGAEAMVMYNSPMIKKKGGAGMSKYDKFERCMRKTKKACIEALKEQLYWSDARKRARVEIELLGRDVDCAHEAAAEEKWQLDEEIHDLKYRKEIIEGQVHCMAAILYIMLFIFAAVSLTVMVTSHTGMEMDAVRTTAEYCSVNVTNFQTVMGIGPTLFRDVANKQVVASGMGSALVHVADTCTFHGIGPALFRVSDVQTLHIIGPAFFSVLDTPMSMAEIWESFVNLSKRFGNNLEDFLDVPESSIALHAHKQMDAVSYACMTILSVASAAASLSF